MPYKFSLTTGGFYPDDIEYAELPADIVNVSDDEHAAAMNMGHRDTLSVADGALVITPYAGPTLAEAQATQIAVLNAAYQAAIVAPVNFITAAGATASFAQDAVSQQNLTHALLGSEKDEVWLLGFWPNAAGVPVAPFTYADLQGLSSAMEVADVPAYQDLLVKIASVMAATTVADVQAIAF